MKTTLEIPDELFIEAKSVAARRRTTLKALMEHAFHAAAKIALAVSRKARFATFDRRIDASLVAGGNAALSLYMVDS